MATNVSQIEMLKTLLETYLEIQIQLYKYLDTKYFPDTLHNTSPLITICKQRRHTKLQMYKAMLEF